MHMQVKLVAAGLVHEEAKTVDGRSLRQVADGAKETLGQQVVVSWDAPLKATGGLAILQPQDSGGVAFFAHIGGFAFGAVTILFVVRNRARAPA